MNKYIIHFRIHFEDAIALCGTTITDYEKAVFLRVSLKRLADIYLGNGHAATICSKCSTNPFYDLIKTDL